MTKHSPVSLQAAGRSHEGRVRTNNEDAYLVAPALSLFAVADGMGGHNAGEVASGVAIQSLEEFVGASARDADATWPYGFDTHLPFAANQLKSAVLLANQQIRYQARQEAAREGMGSTIIAVLVDKAVAYYANVGDSRLYVWRRGVLTQISQDDSWAASMRRAGASAAEIEGHAMRHVLTRALGSAEDLDLTVGQTRLETGDLLLLSSDGLHGPLGDEGIARILAESGSDPETVAAALVDAANAAGGPDNVTAVVVQATAGERGERGQTLIEYVVTAGLLVTAGLMISGLLQRIMWTFVTNVVHELSFLSP